MALLPYLDQQDASPEVAKALRAPVVLNVQRITAHAQRLFPARSRLSRALMTQIRLNPKYRELAILRTAKICRSVYEWTQHLPPARTVGVSEDQIAAIENWEQAACFDEVERLVLKFTDEVNRQVKADRATLEALKRRLSAEEIVELLIIIGHWRQTATILETLEVDLDEFAGKLNILDTLTDRAR